ncbi:MAG: GYF domain-containing protein [Pseudomonadota bacterium]
MKPTATWCMNVSGRIFGPYDTDQMSRFIAEKRLAYHSLVAPAGSRDFRPALQFPELRNLFKPKSADERGAEPQTRAQATKSFLIVFGSEMGGAERASRLYTSLPEVIPLSATTWLVQSDRSADDLRDELARLLPSTERAVVIACSSQSPACHGVSLEEHERISKALGVGAMWARA